VASPRCGSSGTRGPHAPSGPGGCSPGDLARCSVAAARRGSDGPGGRHASEQSSGGGAEIVLGTPHFPLPCSCGAVSGPAGGRGHARAAARSRLGGGGWTLRLRGSGRRCRTATPPWKADAVRRGL
jgi:hypothetical protein